MKRVDLDILVVGGGATGLAAAAKAWELGIEKVALLDEKPIVGGVLPQCIHTGFGLHYFGEDLTGPEFSYRLEKKVLNSGVEIYREAYGMELRYVKVDEKVVVASTSKGLREFHSKCVIIATGARERQRHEIGIVGSRPVGVYTAGEVQTLMDLYGVMPGREVVIVGSGDIGLIMARRFAMQGAEVKCVIEILPYPSGLARNIQQCLIDFNIPLYLSHRVVRVRGGRRVKCVEVYEVDRNLNPIPGTKKIIKCDTLVISAGLIPRIDLLREAGAVLDPSTKSVVVNEFLESTIPGVFVAGNALLINDLVDYVAEQGEKAAEGAVKFIEGDGFPAGEIKEVVRGRNIRLVVPQRLTGLGEVTLYSRVGRHEDNVVVKISELNFERTMFRVKPSTMLRVKVESSRVKESASSKVTISVEPKR
ncbi:MAG TPA: pyridine nucleotide-disulfide oxidoreductase [Candidatus Bathyarchaeota archaeon]|nr:pyridine nucleotide-disulfide oxidoreductase [Candidatus Bathyarchaeota archaeon]